MVVVVIGGAADDGGSRRSCCSFFFFFLPYAKAQVSVFPPRLLLFVLLCFSFYPSFSLSFWSLISLFLVSHLSLFSFVVVFFLFSFSLLCYIYPLYVFVPHCLYSSMFFFPFFSLLFWSCSSILKTPLYFSFVCKTSLVSLWFFLLLFFQFVPPPLCFHSFFFLQIPPLFFRSSPHLFLSIRPLFFSPSPLLCSALFPRIYRQEERGATLPMSNPGDRVGWLGRLCAVASTAHRAPLSNLHHGGKWGTWAVSGFVQVGREIMVLQGRESSSSLASTCPGEKEGTLCRSKRHRFDFFLVNSAWNDIVLPKTHHFI